jgi:hypothetical protein
MPIDKKAFLDSIAGAGTAGNAEEETAEGEPEEMTCGEQLVQALGLNVDPGPVDAALKEAVARYGSSSPKAY